MKSTKLFLLVVLFLASCAAPATATSAPVPTQTLTPKPTATLTLTPIPSPTMTPTPTQIGGTSGKITFSYRKEEFSNDFPELEGEINLFTANVNGTNVIPITNGLDGFNFYQDISPDGKKVLVASATSYNEDANLYVVDLNDAASQPVLIANKLPNSTWTSSAHWIDNSRIAYIANGEEGLGIYISNVNGDAPINIYKNTSGLAQGNPVEILAISDTHIYWGGETRKQQGNYTYVSSFAWMTSLDGEETAKLEFNGEQINYSYLGGSHSLVFSPDVNTIAWSEAATPESGPPYHNYLHVAPVSDINNPYTLEVFSGFPSLQWFPDGTKILVFDQRIIQKPIEEYADFFKKNPHFENLYGVYEVSISPDLPVKNYNLPSEMMSWQSGGASAIMDLYDISPDNRQILVSIYEPNESSGFTQRFGFLNLETYSFSEIEGFYFSNKAVRGVHWIP